MPSRHVLFAVLAFVAAIFVVVAVTHSTASGPALATSCTRPAVAVGAPSPRGTIDYALTGPAGGTYLIALDATSGRLSGERAVLTPSAAMVVTVRQGLTGCRWDGTLSALPAGSGGHRLVVFRDGALVAAARVG